MKSFKETPKLVNSGMYNYRYSSPEKPLTKDFFFYARLWPCERYFTIYGHRTIFHEDLPLNATSDYRILDSLEDDWHDKMKDFVHEMMTHPSTNF